MANRDYLPHNDAEFLAWMSHSLNVWAYRGAPKRFSFRVACRGARERDEGTLSPEETVSVGG
jgi:hypothetical protein